MITSVRSSALKFSLELSLEKPLASLTKSAFGGLKVFASDSLDCFGKTILARKLFGVPKILLFLGYLPAFHLMLPMGAAIPNLGTRIGVKFFFDKILDQKKFPVGKIANGIVKQNEIELKLDQFKKIDDLTKVGDILALFDMLVFCVELLRNQNGTIIHKLNNITNSTGLRTAVGVVFFGAIALSFLEQTFSTFVFFLCEACDVGQDHIQNLDQLELWYEGLKFVLKEADLSKEARIACAVLLFSKTPQWLTQTTTDTLDFLINIV